MSKSSEMEAEGFDVGRRLRRIRESRGFSQRELARRADMTNGNLSMIEQGKVSPSISSLERILRALPMTLAEFFDGPSEDVQPALKRDDALRIAKAAYTLELYHLKRYGVANAYLACQTLNPGESSGADWLAGPAVIWGVIVRGAVELTVGLDAFTLSEGEGFYFSSARSHSFTNLQHLPAELVINAALVSP